VVDLPVTEVGFDGTKLLFTKCYENGACGIFEKQGTSERMPLVAPQIGGGRFLSWDATALFFSDASGLYRYTR
jgi:hypothetical protein